MKILQVVPDGWPVKLSELRAGYFLYDKSLCLKTEYQDGKNVEAYCDSGERFWGGTNSPVECSALEVTPVRVEWNDIDD